MENKSQKENKSSAMPFRPTPEQEAYIKEFQQKRGFKTTAEAIRTIVDEQRNSKGSQMSGSSLPKGCYQCDLRGSLTTNKKGEAIVRCIERIENKQPIIKDRSISEAEACSQKPTYITIPTKEKFEWKIETLEAQLGREAENTDALQRKDAYYEELRKKLIDKDSDIKTLENYQKQIETQLKEANRKSEPMQDLLKARDTLNSKVSDMENTLLERDKKIAILETDNAYKDEMIKKLSESELLSENDALHLELNQKTKLNNEYTLEIKKLEALREKDQQTLNDIISQTKKVFRDFNESVPAWMNSLPFVMNVQKKMKDFEGYVQTITS